MTAGCRNDAVSAFFKLTKNGNFKVRKLKERQSGQQGAVATSYKQWSIIYSSLSCCIVIVHPVIRCCLVWRGTTHLPWLQCVPASSHALVDLAKGWTKGLHDHLWTVTTELLWRSYRYCVLKAFCFLEWRRSYWYIRKNAWVLVFYCACRAPFLRIYQYYFVSNYVDR